MLEKAQSCNAQAASFNAQNFNAYDRPHDDLREFIARAEAAGEIVRIKGADWQLDMGTLAEIVNQPGRSRRRSCSEGQGKIRRHSRQDRMRVACREYLLFDEKSDGELAADRGGGLGLLPLP